MTDDLFADMIGERVGGLCTSYIVVANCEKLETDEPTFHIWTAPIQDEVMTMGLLATATAVKTNHIIGDFNMEPETDD